MKKTLFTTALLLTILNCFGQVKSEKVNRLKIINTETSVEKDSIIKVVYKTEIKYKKPAYFINGKFIDENILKTINPNEISSINIEKGDIEIDNVKYFGKLKIETKNNYNPKLISLNNLKAEYTKLKENQTIFKN